MKRRRLIVLPIIVFFILLKVLDVTSPYKYFIYLLPLFSFILHLRYEQMKSHNKVLLALGILLTISIFIVYYFRIENLLQ